MEDSPEDMLKIRMGFLPMLGGALFYIGMSIWWARGVTETENINSTRILQLEQRMREHEQEDRRRFNEQRP